MYLVIECMTMSQPSASGWVASGVASVLSTQLSAPLAAHSSDTAPRSVTCISGLDGVSIHTSRVLLRHAALSASGPSFWCTKLTSKRPSPATRSRLKLPP